MFTIRPERIERIRLRLQAIRDRLDLLRSLQGNFADDCDRKTYIRTYETWKRYEELCERALKNQPVAKRELINDLIEQIFDPRRNPNLDLYCRATKKSKDNPEVLGYTIFEISNQRFTYVWSSPESEGS